MEHPTSRVTPYELATLAARISPERCLEEPQSACDAAVRLLCYAFIVLIEQRDLHRAGKEKNTILRETRIDWSRAIKDVTSEARRDRAIKRFKQFLEYLYPGEAEERLTNYKRDGITLRDVSGLRDVFRLWRQQSKRKKGKQGRRKSEYDGRLRTELVGLVPRKPRTRA